MAHVGVVGGGVVGLTTALRLARAGHEVDCIRDAPAAETVSALAGGLWLGTIGPGLHVFNALDENGLDASAPAEDAEHRLTALDLWHT